MASQIRDVRELFLGLSDKISPLTAMKGSFSNGNKIHWHQPPNFQIGALSSNNPVILTRVRSLYIHGDMEFHKRFRFTMYVGRTNGVYPI